MGNRPSSVIATIAAVGTAGYFIYRSYNYSNGNGDSGGTHELSGIESDVEDERIMDEEEEEEEEEPEQVDNHVLSIFQQRTLMQYFVVSILAVLAIVTLIVSILRGELPTDLPLFVPLFWTTIGLGIATTGVQQQQNTENMIKNNLGAENSNENINFNLGNTSLSLSSPSTSQISGDVHQDDERKVDDDSVQVDGIAPEATTTENKGAWSKSNVSFKIRGKHYLDSQHPDFKKKITSSEPLYEPLYLTVRHTNAGETIDIHNIQGLPESVTNEQNKVNACDPNEDFKGMTSTLPNILLLHQILPVDQPSLWSTTTKEDSPSVHLLVYFKLTEKTKQSILSEESNNVSSLLKTWIEPHDPLFDHWKTIIKLRNPEKIDIGIIGNQLIRQSNGKPFLSYGSAQRDVYPNDKIVVTVDAYKFTYAMRNFYYNVLQTEDSRVLKNAIIDMAFFIEGRRPEHLPEQILGSFTISDLQIFKEDCH